MDLDDDRPMREATPTVGDDANIDLLIGDLVNGKSGSALNRTRPSRADIAGSAPSLSGPGTSQVASRQHQAYRL